MTAPIPMPTPEDLALARSIYRAARLARLREKRAESRANRPPRVRRYKLAAFICPWCGLAFTARVINRPVIGRYCSPSCRELSYQNRKRRAAKREADRAAVLVAAGIG